MKVSVLMPVYKPNREWLVESIKSIVNQTFKDWELLILDDNPKGYEFDYQSVLNEFKDDRIKLLSNGDNLKVSASMNKLIGLAQGEYLAWHDCDDISLSNRFEEEVKLLDGRDDIDVVSGFVEKFGKETGIMGSQVFTTHGIRKAFIRQMVITNSTVMARKVSLLKGDLYDTNYTKANDYEFWSRRKDLDHFIIQNVLVKYRIHDNQDTSDKEALKSATLKVIQRNIKVDIEDQKVALVCIAKDEDNYIEEWLDYHLKLGFDKAYVYCNDWIWKVPEKYGDKVEAIDFPGLKQQIPAYDDFIKKHYFEYNFAAFTDIDEYIVLKQLNNIKQALYNYRDVSCLRLPIRTFGNNGLDKVEDGNYSVVDRFIKARPIYESIGKNIINFDILKNRVKFIDENWFGHIPCTNPSRTMVWNGYYNYFINDEGGNNEPIELNHYITKTWEEYVARKKNTDAKKGVLNYPEDKIRVAYDMINNSAFANAKNYTDAYDFKHGLFKQRVFKYNFKVNFNSINGIPIIKERYTKESGVLICKDKSNMLYRVNCDLDGQASFNNLTMVDGTYYIRGIWKEGYYNFTKYYVVKFENGKIYYNGKETNKIIIDNGF
jgi:glycosyltransferase involved in cell wall biosynthesis